MALQTVEAPQRRKLRFLSFDDIIADAQRARDQGYVQLGNWSLGQAVSHLAAGMDASIDGVPFPTSLRTRILGRLVFRYVILYWRFPPGVRLPRETARILVSQNDTDFEEGMQSLRRGIERLATETRRLPHPVVGRMSVAQWNRFHFRHAELHLSFFAPPGR